MMGGWVTNIHAFARELRAADMRYDAAVREASHLPLFSKAEAIRRAGEQLRADYDAVYAKARGGQKP